MSSITSLTLGFLICQRSKPTTLLGYYKELRNSGYEVVGRVLDTHSGYLEMIIPPPSGEFKNALHAERNYVRYSHSVHSLR